MPRKKQLNGSAEETEAAFYEALSRADIDALMALWAEDEEIVCIHPGAPRLVGHAAIRTSWEAIFERGSLHVRPVLLHATHNLMCSIHNIVEQVRQADLEPQDIHILSTNVYLKTPRGWRIALHHASVAPGLAPKEPVRTTTLH
ncbi:MAG: nuclear transport factor 2 family protein [Pseudomonadota bacterium]